MLELAMTLAILVLIVVVIVPLLRASANRAEDFRCETSLRRGVFDFTVFARESGASGFTLERFVQSMYGVGEYWAHEGDMQTRVEAREVFGCAAEPSQLTLDGREDCLLKQVGPSSGVSYGFNARLARAELPGGVGRGGTAPVRLDRSVFGLGRAPLVWDIDGAEAGRRGVIAHFSAPAIRDEAFYGDGRRWFPARRHGGAVYAGFLDGSVGSSADPLRESGWSWSAQTIE
jgi:prepilin-type processing-associated H-X9-DG protein